jgi:CheY-like chemotaxis protein
VEEPAILLVEDDPLVLLVAQDALEAGGYSVIVATSGDEAMTAIENRCQDLSGLVTDVKLGAGPTGWDVARRARELKGDLPVVYSTTDSEGDWPAQGVPNSVVVQKPYAPAQLLTAIANLMTTADTQRTS